jgi:hypothetical protein
MAAQVDASVQHVAEGTKGTLIQRGLPLLSRTIQHTAGIYGFLARLHEEAAQQKQRVLWWEIGSWCERCYHEHGAWHTLRPDAAFEYQTEAKHIRAWLEWDEGTMTGGALAAKLHTYTHYLSSRKWARELHALPLLLIVTPEPGQERRVWHLGATLAAEEPQVYTTTATRLAQHGPVAPIWHTLLPESPHREAKRCSWTEAR